MQYKLRYATCIFYISLKFYEKTNLKLQRGKVREICLIEKI